MRSGARVLVGAAALALAAGQCGVGGEAEGACLDAVAHLSACCPGFNASLFVCGDGDEHASGCIVVFRSPAISLDESRCIGARSCADLRDGGICTRAGATAGAASAGSPLCP